MKDWVTLARVVRPRGNRGEVLAEPLSDNRDRFSGLREVTLFQPGNEGLPMRVESAWWHQDRLVLKFEGIESISQAESLRGASVSIPASERAPLEAGEFYRDDLIGCELVERLTGRQLGRVTGWQDFGGTPLIEAGGMLIPFAASMFVKIDLERRRIEVDLPEGLKDLNRR